MIDRIVVDAVKEAAGYVLQRQGNVGEVEKKSPKDFVTDVDREAERIIIENIRRNIPDACFYGEETGRSGQGRYLCVIDPVDATTNFIRGIPLFDISIAVWEGDQMILGVIACPKLDELYVAERGKGAFLNGGRIHVSTISRIEEAIIGYNRSNHPPEIVQPAKRVVANIIERAATLRVFGTGGLDYCYLAKGSFDACITPLAEPFHSAGYLIMKEAGAKVTDYEGNPYSLESRTIVAANPELHAQVLELVRG